KLRRARAGRHQVGGARKPRDRRGRDLRQCRRDPAHLLREALHPRARQEGGEGLRAAARDPARYRPGRHRPGGAAHPRGPRGGAVVRTREDRSAVMPRGDARVLVLLRYPQEVVDASEHRLPEGEAADYRINPKEREMARQLIEAMSGEWNPAEYRNEFRERL